MTEANFRCTNFAHSGFRKQKGKVAKSFQHLAYAAALTAPASRTAEPVITLVGNFRVNTRAQTRLQREKYEMSFWQNSKINKKRKPSRLHVP